MNINSFLGISASLILFSLPYLRIASQHLTKSVLYPKSTSINDLKQVYNEGSIPFSVYSLYKSSGINETNSGLSLNVRNLFLNIPLQHCDVIIPREIATCAGILPLQAENIDPDKSITARELPRMPLFLTFSTTVLHCSSIVSFSVYSS